jgi:predicted nucleotidyltransferase
MRDGHPRETPCPLIASLVSLLARYPAIKLGILFGSLAAGRATPDSDLDLGVAASHVLDTAMKTALIEALAEMIRALQAALDCPSQRQRRFPMRTAITRRHQCTSHRAPQHERLAKHGDRKWVWRDIARLRYSVPIPTQDRVACALVGLPHALLVNSPGVVGSTPQQPTIPPGR